MSMLWIVPVLVLVAGLGVVTMVLRSVDEVGAEVARQLRDLGEVRQAVAVVRARTDTTRAALDDLRQR